LYLTRDRYMAANRAGAITAEQYQRLLRPEFDWLTVIAGLLVVISLGAAWLLWRNGLAQGDPSDISALSTVALLAGGLAAIYFGWWLRRRQLIRRDIAESAIAAADGHITWEWGRYVAQFPDRPTWTSNVVSGLAPGPYRFYYLPLSGYILSAQKLKGAPVAAATVEPATISPAAPELNDVLQLTVGFDAADLAANQAGRITPRQAWRLWRQVGLILLLVAFITAVAVHARVTGEAIKGMGTPVYNVLALMMVGLFGYIAVQTALDVTSGEAVSIEGPGKRGLRSRTPSIFVGGQEFFVSRDVCDALVPGLIYRVYYAPRTKRVLSITSRGLRRLNRKARKRGPA
jgi:hypothetical protein